MSRHDPLCPIEWLHGSGPSGFTKVPCQCDLIERVRESQREEDALIVEGLYSAYDERCAPSRDDRAFYEAVLAIRAGA